MLAGRAPSSLVITDSALADRLPEGAAALLLLDGGRDAIAAEPADGAVASASIPENLAYVIFTSGLHRPAQGGDDPPRVDGRPAALAAGERRRTRSARRCSSPRPSTSTSPSRSCSARWRWGGTLVLVENALELADGRRAGGATSAWSPAPRRSCCASAGSRATVRTLNLGGEALPERPGAGAATRSPADREGRQPLRPTEDTTYSTYSLVPRGAEQVLRSAGRWRTRRRTSWTAQLQPVPMGVAGELYLGGRRAGARLREPSRR